MQLLLEGTEPEMTRKGLGLGDNTSPSDANILTTAGSEVDGQPVRLGYPH